MLQFVSFFGKNWLIKILYRNLWYIIINIIIIIISYKLWMKDELYLQTYFHTKYFYDRFSFCYLICKCKIKSITKQARKKNRILKIPTRQTQRWPQLSQDKCIMPSKATTCRHFRGVLIIARNCQQALMSYSYLIWCKSLITTPKFIHLHNFPYEYVQNKLLLKLKAFSPCLVKMRGWSMI